MGVVDPGGPAGTVSALDDALTEGDYAMRTRNGWRRTCPGGDVDLAGCIVRAGMLAAVLVVAVGCASMHHGRTQHVIVTSDPPGARIFAGDEPVGVTPDFVTVNRCGAVLRLERNGFRTEEIRLPRSPSAWLAGSTMLAAPFFWTGSYALALALTVGIDIGTGAAWKFPERVEAVLDPERAPGSPGAP